MAKTGGTTLNHIINNNYEKEATYHIYTADQKEKTKMFNEISLKNPVCVQGHFPFGVHKYFKNKSEYVTLIRNPIDRIISEYYFIQSFSWPPWLDKKNPAHQKIVNFSFEEHIRQPGNKNKQVRFISGNQKIQLNKTDLDTAIHNINNFFVVAGITEKFDESLFLMKEKLDWKNVHYQRTNVTKKRPRLNDLSSNLIKLIEKNNRLDIELYNFAKKRLNDQIHQLDSEDKSKLKSFLSQANN